jgi:site-specific DNA recombinase
MADGTRKKAESGRVTARRPAFGLRFVDENGNEGERARKFTYYAIREDEATVVRLIYERIARGDTMIQIAKDLDEAGVPKPKRTTHWEGSLLPKLVRNPVYKGEFIAHCFTTIEVEEPTKDGLSTRLAKKRVMRPESEWIRVPVPAIVDPATWQAANDMLAKNKAMAARNADSNERYLLTGLVKCADCGYSYGGRTQHPTPRSTLKHTVRSYFCRKATPQPNHIAAGAAHACHQRQIAASVLEPAVWRVVCDALLKPDVLLAALEADAFNEQNAQLEQQIAYLEGEIAAKTTEDEKLYRAYVAGVFDEIEYADRRRSLKMETARLTNATSYCRSACLSSS